MTVFRVRGRPIWPSIILFFAQWIFALAWPMTWCHSRDPLQQKTEWRFQCTPFVEHIRYQRYAGVIMVHPILPGVNSSDQSTAVSLSEQYNVIILNSKDLRMQLSFSPVLSASRSSSGMQLLGSKLPTKLWIPRVKVANNDGFCFQWSWWTYHWLRGEVDDENGR